MKTISQIIDGLYRKTILFNPNADGTFTWIDITGESTNKILKISDITVELKPKLIYKVSGLKRTANFCVKRFDSTQLVDLFSDDAEQMTEKTFMDALENAENAGRLQAESGGVDAEKRKKQLSLILICSILTVMGIIVLIYMKAQGI